MKKIVLLIFLISTIASSQNKKTKIYSDEFIKFSYPKSWKITNKIQTPDNLIALYPKKGEKLYNQIPTTKISIYKTPKGKYTSLDNFTNHRLKLLKTNAKEIKLKTINSKFNSINVISYFYNNYTSANNQKGIEIKLIEYNFIVKNIVYSFYYEATIEEFDSYTNAAKGIFSTLEIY